MPSMRGGPKRPAHIGSVLTGTFDSPRLNVKARLTEYDVKKAWAGVVGKNIARRSRPKKLINDTLHVTVSTSAWMTELMHLKPDILAKLNRGIGREAVKEIVFRAGMLHDGPARAPVRPGRELTEEELESIEKAVAGVKDDALKGLIRRVMAKGKSLED